MSQTTRILSVCRTMFDKNTVNYSKYDWLLVFLGLVWKTKNKTFKYLRDRYLVSKGNDKSALLLAFHSPPLSPGEKKELNTLCPVRALHVYMSVQLFVFCDTP